MTPTPHYQTPHEPREPAELQVLVLDFECELRRDATVEIIPSGTQQGIKLEYDEYMGRYTTTVAPGDYHLDVRVDPSMDADQRRISLHAGKNLVYSSHAPSGTPFFYGSDQEKVFFKPDEGHLLLYASGHGVTEKLPEILRKKGIRTEPLPERQSQGRSEKTSTDKPSTDAPDSACFMIPNPPMTEEPSHEAWLAFQQEIEKMGYNCRLAAPLLRGKGIIDGLTNEFVVRFTPEASREHVQQAVKDLGCEIDHRITWMPNGFLMRVPGFPGYHVLTLIRAFLDLPEVIYAEPDIVFHINSDFIPSDYLYPEQSYAQVIHAEEAWETMEHYLGAAMRAGSPDITIAIFDNDGISPDHPDLTGTLSDGSPKMVANHDFYYRRAQTVANLGGDHGTACASVAAGGFNNAVGFAGIAGNCHLIGARIQSDWTGLDLAYAWMWAAGLPTGPGYPAPPSRPADVISNSWGNDDTPMSNTIRDALDYLTIYGRGGKGCVVCFSVGNIGYRQFTPVRRYAAYFRTIAVGASINRNPTNPTSSYYPDPADNTVNLPALVDTRAYFSPYGPEMDLVAPSNTTYIHSGTVTIDPTTAATRVGTGTWIGRAATSTHTSEQTFPGNRVLPVMSSAGFASGMKILIGTPGRVPIEFNEVRSVGSGTITVASALVNAYTRGTPVATGPNDYDRTFGGTSHSCPCVAGAAALVLSVRPHLTWVQVRRILHESSDRIDTRQTNSTGRWVDNDRDGLNEFSQWYGFGRLNLDRAVQAAHNPDLGADIVVRDNIRDNGGVPSREWWAASPDIWVSSTDVPVPDIPYNTDPTVADPSLTNAVRGHDNFVFVRVHNWGTAPSDQCWVRAYIANFPGFEFRYPQDWMPSTGSVTPGSFTPGTYLIGEQRVDRLESGGTAILKFTWPAALIPPDSVTVAGITTQWHPCLLAEVSPHDGPSAPGGGIPVQQDNNLAQRNIWVSGPGPIRKSRDSCAVVAGTSAEAGVKSFIVDRSLLEPRALIFMRVDHEGIMNKWIDLAREQDIQAIEPFGQEEMSQSGATPPEETHLEGPGSRSRDEEIYTFSGTPFRISHRKSLLKPKASTGKIQGLEVVFFEGGTHAIELPLDLVPEQYVPVVIGLERGGGTLRISQRLFDGEISAGYEIRRYVG